jgi:hypothetical protein
MSVVKRVLALGLIVIGGFVGYQLSDPLYDAAAGSLCGHHAANHQLTLEEAHGRAAGYLAFRSFPEFACRFSDSSGPPVWIDENDGIIEPTWPYRSLRIAAWGIWVGGIIAGAGAASKLGLFDTRSMS